MQWGANHHHVFTTKQHQLYPYTNQCQSQTASQNQAVLVQAGCTVVRAALQVLHLAQYLNPMVAQDWPGLSVEQQYQHNA